MAHALAIVNPSTHTFDEGDAPRIQPFYTVEEVADLLRLARTELFAEIRRGRLRSIKRGRSRRVPAEFVAEYRTLLIKEGMEGDG